LPVNEKYFLELIYGYILKFAGVTTTAVVL
jgi:hypothetical protein